MNVNELLDTIEDTLEESTSMPLSGGKRLVDVEKVRDYLDDIRANLPGELRQAQQIVNDRAQIVDTANAQAQAIVKKAEERARILVSDAEIVKAAQQRAAARRAQEAEQPDLPPKAEALAHMQALCRAYYPQFAAVCPGGQMPKIAVRDMHTRWGSCSLRTGTLAFAQRLCVMPPAAQEYVVVHEFCHFAHPNHSPAFWAAVEKVLPDYRQREKLLKMR